MGSSNSKQNQTEAIIQQSRNGTPIKYKTSIYGWGKLSHPVKAGSNNGGVKKKKKKKWVDPMEPFLTNQKSQRKSEGDLMVNLSNFIGFSNRRVTKSNPEIPLLVIRSSDVKNGRIEDKLNGRHSRTLEQAPGPSVKTAEKVVKSSRKISFNFNTPKNNTSAAAAGVSSRKITLPVERGISKQGFGGGPTYYGQFRCCKCQKYWRSGIARDGVAQNCSKCGTPTYPKH